MKSNKSTALLCYAAILLIWLIPATKMMLTGKAISFAVVFFVSGLILRFISNKKIAVIAVLIINSAIMIYSYEYIFVAAPAIFLILSLYFIYQEKDKKKQSYKSKENMDWSNLFATTTVLIFIAKAIYAFARLQTNIGQNTENLVLAIKSASSIFLFFVTLIIVTLVSGRNEPSADVKWLRKIYIISVSGIAVSVFYYYAVNPFSTHSPQLEFIYWITIIIYMAVSGDPNMNLLLTKVKKCITGEKKA